MSKDGACGVSVIYLMDWQDNQRKWLRNGCRSSNARQLWSATTKLRMRTKKEEIGGLNLRRNRQQIDRCTIRDKFEA
jgi:hypothetical protein